MTRGGQRLEGGAIVGLAAMALVALVAVAGLPVIIRGTARGALVFLCAAASASALVRLHPSSTTAWLRRNRRPLGLSFALWHLTHAAAVVLAMSTGVQRVRPLGVLIAGGSVFVVIALMAATSSDAAVRLMGAAAWSRLHTF